MSVKENNWVIDLDSENLILVLKKWYSGHMGRKEVRLVHMAQFYNMDDAREYIEFKTPGAKVVVTEAAQEYGRVDR